jgi:hypothetical protein
MLIATDYLIALGCFVFAALYVERFTANEVGASGSFSS